ncbi:MAG: hypothetical protein JSV57_03220 [Candidatus Bathyarchaeota archaeon]|nr:MAG: hypothetical protein JSV57_03220 [Candidatus Bathyarchaeota archaeon]
MLNPVDLWLSDVAVAHSGSEKTEYAYRHNLESFLKFIGMTAEQIIAEYERSRDRDFRRKYARLLRSWIADLNEDHTKGSIKVMTAAVKSFFNYSDLPLAKVPVPKGYVVFHNRDLTQEEIAIILSVSNPRDKALWCVLAQSGVRPQLIVKLKRKHLEDLATVPCKIDAPRELSKGKYGHSFTFIGSDAVELIRNYFKTRPNLTPESYIFTKTGREEPLTRKAISAQFYRKVRSLKKAGDLDFKTPSGKPAEIRLYNLRKWFRKQSQQAGVEYVNFWMGHVTSYRAPHIPRSDDAYFPKENVEFHRRLYKEKAMPFLRIEHKTPSETESLIEEQIARIEQLERQLAERDRLLSHDIVRMADLYSDTLKLQLSKAESEEEKAQIQKLLAEYEKIKRERA